MDGIKKFELVSEFAPAGDQPEAIDQLVQGVKNKTIQTLLGVTGSGKTFSVANVIAKTGKNTLIISHNKTLAAQLHSELKQLFPNNNVGYFVSYYDYYQPESYMVPTDTYIEKDTMINDEISRMRLEATTMLLSGDPTIIVSTVSCIYSLGNPQNWNDMSIKIESNEQIRRDDLIQKLIDAGYERNDVEVAPGCFRAKGDTIDVIPAYSNDVIFRISMFGSQIDRITVLDHVSLAEKSCELSLIIRPARHYIIQDRVRDGAIKSIRKELEERLPELRELERQRLEMRTNYDLEMIEELGFCSGIENYSRHFDGREPGMKAYCLLDFFGDDYLLVIDESHATVPQISGMYKGDHSRKKGLITYGFRLPSAFDNRPLKFQEFEPYIKKNTIFLSATPAQYELDNSSNVVEQLVRPTGLVDPPVTIRPKDGQIDDLISEIQKRSELSERTLVTTLTKRMAEDLSEHLSEKGVRVRYLHSEIKGLDRTEIIRQLRLGVFDVIVGINLLREGLDIPEVSLVAILDADKSGFLRNYTSLIQIFGRASRNTHGTVIMYADMITKSMQSAMDETSRRREKQILHNKKYGIIPKTIVKSIPEKVIDIDDSKVKTLNDLQADIKLLRAQMNAYSDALNFEYAINCRDKLKKLENELRLRDVKKQTKNQRRTAS